MPNIAGPHHNDATTAMWGMAHTNPLAPGMIPPKVDTHQTP